MFIYCYFIFSQTNTTSYFRVIIDFKQIMGEHHGDGVE